MDPTPDATRAANEHGLYRIGKQFGFQATRSTDGVPDGSGFVVEITLAAGVLTEPGFVVDFGALAPLGHYLEQALDHRSLDDVFGAGGTGNTQVAMHLEAWCRANLTIAAAERLERVAVRCGRPAGSGPNDLLFSAQHRIGGLPDGHKCGRDHGHTYLVGPLPGQDALPDVLRCLVATLDGSVLNEVLDDEPTSEHLARYLLHGAREQGAARLGALRVSETATSWAQYHSEQP